MYIKQVIKGNRRTNKKYKYLHLVESIQTEKGPPTTLQIANEKYTIF